MTVLVLSILTVLLFFIKTTYTGTLFRSRVFHSVIHGEIYRYNVAKWISVVSEGIDVLVYSATGNSNCCSILFWNML
jgi:hypothetical protein